MVNQFTIITRSQRFTLYLVEIFALFNKHDHAQRGYLTLATVYNLLGERRTIFGDSLFELIGEP